MNLKLPFEINFVQRLIKVIADEKVAFKIQSKLQFSRWFRCVARRLSAEKMFFCEKMFFAKSFFRSKIFSEIDRFRNSKVVNPQNV